jgi:dsDNA-specific endonuclease/ATPase MutS2
MYFSKKNYVLPVKFAIADSSPPPPFPLLRCLFKNQKQRPSAPEADPGWRPSVGDKVFIPRISTVAKVVAVAPSGVLTLQAGLLKLTASKEEVQKR